MKTSAFQKRLAGNLNPGLRLRAEQLASGYRAGNHRADRKGSGIEFAGHRAYTPGDDLRHLDRHALLRHGRYLIREFHTDTERTVHLIVDATTSMHYSGDPKSARSQDSKFECAALLAAALAYISVRSGDSVGLSIVTDEGQETVPPRAGFEALEACLHRLEKLTENSGNLPAKAPAREGGAVAPWSLLFDSLGTLLPRGSCLFLFTDFLDFEAEESAALLALTSQKRSLRATQVLTSEELEFPFEGTTRFRDTESLEERETDATLVRAQYKQALDNLTLELRQELSARRGSFERLSTSEDHAEALHRLARGLRESKQ